MAPASKVAEEYNNKVLVKKLTTKESRNIMMNKMGMGMDMGKAKKTAAKKKPAKKTAAKKTAMKKMGKMY